MQAQFQTFNIKTMKPFTVKNPPKEEQWCFVVTTHGKVEEVQFLTTNRVYDEMRLACGWIFPHTPEGRAEADAVAERVPVDMMPVPQLTPEEIQQIRHEQEMAKPESPWRIPEGYIALLRIIEKHLLPYVNLAEGPQN